MNWIHIPEVYLHILATCLDGYNRVLNKQINTDGQGKEKYMNQTRYI